MKVIIEFELGTAAFAPSQVVEAVTKLVHEGEISLDDTDARVRDEITNVTFVSSDGSE